MSQLLPCIHCGNKPKWKPCPFGFRPGEWYCKQCERDYHRKAAIAREQKIIDDWNNKNLPTTNTKEE
jgi:hypothetical protein